MNRAQLRRLIMEKFSEEDLKTFCFDFYYESVYRQFTVGMTFSLMVRHLLDACQDPEEWKQLQSRLHPTLPNLTDTPSQPQLGQTASSLDALGNSDQDRPLQAGVDENVAKDLIAVSEELPSDDQSLSSPVQLPTICPQAPDRLQSLGFDCDPFAFRKAEEMHEISDKDWEGLIVTHQRYNEILMNLSNSAVILAPRGGGKTTSVKQLERALNQRRQAWFDRKPIDQRKPATPLVAKYVNFDGLDFVHVREHKDREHILRAHEKPLLNAVASTILAFMHEEPARFLRMTDDRRGWVWRFIKLYIRGEPIKDQLKRPCLADDYSTQTNRGSLERPFLVGTTLATILGRLLNRLEDMRIDGMYFLVDTNDSISVEELQLLIQPLLTLRPQGSQNLRFKFFLPNTQHEFIHRMDNLHGIVDVTHIVWDEDSLEKVLRQRIAWASNGRWDALRQISDDHPVSLDDDYASLDQELCQMALRHKTLGPPRALLELGSRFIRGLL